jgi:predicted TIM-barrel fold metal-dependent hydrolase
MSCGSAESTCDWCELVRLLTQLRLKVPALLATWGACAWAGSVEGAAGASYYSLPDFQQVGKIDAHVHIHGSADRFMAQAIHDNFRILTINVDYPDFPSISEQQRAAVALRQRYPGLVAFAAAFSVQNFEAPDWASDALRQIDLARKQGAVGVKVWKNIGMSLRDNDGRYVMPDDRRLEPIFAALERDHVVLLGHQAEPLNCWLPFDKMTVGSDRDYFREHPQYYMYQHPEMPSHDAILSARDRMLSAHPALRFDAVHLASLEWDVDKISAFLDRFPGANVDLAARLVHLEFQASNNPQKVRRFLMRYQDRILYGSDDSYGPADSDQRAVADVHSGWVEDWRFLATSDRLHSSDFEKSFLGMHLPKDVIDKIYRRNAESMFTGAWSVPP